MNFESLQTFVISICVGMVIFSIVLHAIEIINSLQFALAEGFSILTLSVLFVFTDYLENKEKGVKE